MSLNDVGHKQSGVNLILSEGLSLHSPEVAVQSAVNHMSAQKLGRPKASSVTQYLLFPAGYTTRHAR